MAEQRLDVKVTENGTAVVTSKLDKLDEKLAQLTKTGEAQSASAAQMASALDKVGSANERLVSFLDKTNSKMAAVEKVAGVLAKVNLAWQLVTTAVKFAAEAVDKYINGIKALGPALDVINAKLQKQSDIIKGMTDVRTRILSMGGTINEAARAGAATLAQKEAQGKLAALDIEAQQRNVITSRADQARANLAEQERNRRLDATGLVKAPTPTPEQAEVMLAAIGLRSAEQIEADRQKVSSELFGLELDLKKLEADINKRERGGDGGGGGDSGSPRGRPGEVADVLGGSADMSGLDFGGTQLSDVLTLDKLDAQATFDELFGPENVSDALAFADGLSKVAEQLEAIRKAEEEVAKQREQGAAMATAYGEATIQAGLAAAAFAIAEGENAFAALAASMKARAIQATVDAAFYGVRGLFTGNPKDIALSEGLAGVAAMAGGAAALASAASGGRGGRAGVGAAPPAESDFGPRREDSRAGEPVTINIYNDPLTREQFGAVVLDGLEAAGQSAGMRGRAQRVLRGGGY